MAEAGDGLQSFSKRESEGFYPDPYQGYGQNMWSSGYRYNEGQNQEVWDNYGHLYNYQYNGQNQKMWDHSGYGYNTEYNGQNRNMWDTFGYPYSTGYRMMGNRPSNVNFYDL